MSYWADLYHAVVQVGPRAGALIAIFAAMWFLATADERRHARRRDQREQWQCARSRERVMHVVERKDVR